MMFQDMMPFETP